MTKATRRLVMMMSMPTHSDMKNRRTQPDLVATTSASYATCAHPVNGRRCCDDGGGGRAHVP